MRVGVGDHLIFDECRRAEVAPAKGCRHLVGVEPHCRVSGGPQNFFGTRQPELDAGMCDGVSIADVGAQMNPAEGQHRLQSSHQRRIDPAADTPVRNILTPFRRIQCVASIRPVAANGGVVDSLSS